MIFCCIVLREDRSNYGSPSHSERSFYRLAHAWSNSFFNHESIDHDFNVMRFITVQF